MAKKSIKELKPTLADAFEVGKREGLKEAFLEIKALLDQKESTLSRYLDARLKSLLDFTKNPFKG